MRVLIINTFYYPNMQGGAEQSVKLLAENLVKHGHEVAVFCGDSRDGMMHEEIIEGVKIYRSDTGKLDLFRACYNKKSVGIIGKLRNKLLMLYNTSNKERFAKVCREFKPDVIHSNSLFGLSYYLWKMAYKMGIPVVHTVRDTDLVSPVQHGRSCNPITAKVHRIFIKHITRYVTAVTAPSAYTLRTTLETGCLKNTKVQQVIENSVAVDMEKLEKVLAEKEQRTSDVIKYMYAGRLIYFKGIEHMMDAFARLDNENARLIICGGGEMTDFVEKRAAEDSRIDYRGKLSNAELEAAYREADVLLVPSMWPEPFGRVVIEGNLGGLPVIAGNFGGIPEIVGQMKGGILYKEPTAECLADAMNSLSSRGSHREYYENIRSNMMYYDINRQIESFVKVYQKIQKAE